jgi:hypothetical protein
VHDEADVRILAEGRAGDLREMLRVLRAGGLRAELVRPPDTNVNR